MLFVTKKENRRRFFSLFLILILNLGTTAISAVVVGSNDYGTRLGGIRGSQRQEEGPTAKYQNNNTDIVTILPESSSLSSWLFSSTTESESESESVAVAQPSSHSSRTALQQNDVTVPSTDQANFQFMTIPQIEKRVVGGSNANAVDYPYNVIWSVGCGGTLIYEDIVLSAGHCYSGRPDSIQHSKVWVGNQYGRDGQYRKIQDIVRPREYENNDAYDISILKLEQPITNIQPIKLNNDSSTPSSSSIDKLTIIGFGKTSEDQQARFHHTLQEAEVDYIPYNACIKNYNSHNIDKNIVFCAASEGIDTCQGDSGGAILGTDNDGTTVQVGVTSWGTGCGRSILHPGVYVRISYVHRWIQNQVCTMTDNPHPSCIPVQIRFTVDRYPLENRFMLRDKSSGSNNIMIMYKKLPDSLPPGDSVVYNLRLLPGSYQLEVIDTYGDGMCCNFQPSGSYSLWTGTEYIERNGDFGKSESVDFEVFVNGTEYGSTIGTVQQTSTSPTSTPSKAPTEPPTTNPPTTSTPTEAPTTLGPTSLPTTVPTNAADSFLSTSDENDEANPTISATKVITSSSSQEVQNPRSLSIELQYDDHPTQTSWTLSYRSMSLGRWVKIYDSSDDTDKANIPSIKMTYIFHNLAPGKYKFRILDSSFNGICCDHGVGWFQLTDVTDDANPISLYHGDGKFRWFDYVSFDL